MSDARLALKTGDVTKASKLVSQAEKIDVVYETSMTVRNRPRRHRAARRRSAGSSRSSGVGPECRNQKKAALSLLKQAREAMELGNSRVAQTKAQQAAQYDVTYDLFEDTPEMILAEVERAGANAVASKGTAAPQVATADTQFEEAPVLEGSALEL